MIIKTEFFREIKIFSLEDYLKIIEFETSILHV